MKSINGAMADRNDTCVPMDSAEFSRRVLTWFDSHGRKHLPWQQEPTPYRVWISEIMLQQTQVATVIPYYQRFMARFPTVITLADADLDQVLHLWSGLGYYARGRNLHKAAIIIRDRYHGCLPLDIGALCQLPGIGRSTAGAILALASGQRHAILDGNVKRLLARFRAVEGWPGHSRVLALLWELAETYTPQERVADYTQAMMDLGAMVCTRRPQCGACPLAVGCVAHALGRETEFPEPKPRRQLPVRQTRMLLLRTDQAEVLLEKRPPSGVWGGLWSLPECPSDAVVVEWCHDVLGVKVEHVRSWAMMRHTFSHFHLDITPISGQIKNPANGVMEAGRFVWYNTRQPDARGLAAPVQRLLSILANDG